MSKILNNKEALQAILDGKIVKSVAGTQYKYDSTLDSIMALVKTRWISAKHFNEYGMFTLVEPDRETITLYEHLCGYGGIKFLTKGKQYVSSTMGIAILNTIPDPHKCHKLYRNGVCQKVKVYADTLEYVKEGEWADL